MQHTDAENPDPRETQRANILEGARRVFARKGKAATMTDVAQAAGVSQGLAYRYFVSKEEIFHELIEQVFQTPSTKWQHILEMDATPGERLALLVSKLVEARRQYPEIYQLIDQVQSSEKTPADLIERIRQQGQAFRDVMKQLIIEGQATGEVATGDPDQLVTAVVACLEGLTRLALHNLEQFNQSCPDAKILLRMLQPGSDWQ